MYIRNVEPRLLGMLKDLNIKNGPVFMQGFIDGDTVRFYDPGYRFPGSEYDTMFEQIWNVDIMKMMVEFALTGKMNNQYFKLTNKMERLNGKYVITLWPTVRAGTVAEINGVDIVSALPEVIGYTFRHEVGETIPQVTLTTSMDNTGNYTSSDANVYTLTGGEDSNGVKKTASNGLLNAECTITACRYIAFCLLHFALAQPVPPPHPRRARISSRRDFIAATPPRRNK